METVASRRERVRSLSERIEPLQRYLAIRKQGVDEKANRALAKLVLGEQAEDIAVLSEDELITVVDQSKQIANEAEAELQSTREELHKVKSRIADASRRLDAPNAEPRRVKPGDILVIEVLESLRGRPISGEYVVRADGTITLSFYGEIAVAGLNRMQIKERVIVHLRKYLSDETLGLVGQDEKTGKKVMIPPGESDRVFVDDAAREYLDSRDSKLEALERRLERAVEEIESLKRGD